MFKRFLQDLESQQWQTNVYTRTYTHTYTLTYIYTCVCIHISPILLPNTTRTARFKKMSNLKLKKGSPKGSPKGLARHFSFGGDGAANATASPVRPLSMKVVAKVRRAGAGFVLSRGLRGKLEFRCYQRKKGSNTGVP